MSRAFLKAVFEIKIKLNFYFHTSLCASKGFMKALKAFIKAFEATQRSVKIKIYLNFFTLFWIGTLRVKNKDTINIKHSAQ